jgi:hypothetical protein
MINLAPARTVRPRASVVSPGGASTRAPGRPRAVRRPFRARGGTATRPALSSAARPKRDCGVGATLECGRPRWTSRGIPDHYGDAGSDGPATDIGAWGGSSSLGRRMEVLGQLQRALVAVLGSSSASRAARCSGRLPPSLSCAWTACSPSCSHKKLACRRFTSVMHPLPPNARGFMKPDAGAE